MDFLTLRPPQQGLRRDDGSESRHESPPQGFSFGRQAASLVVVQPNPPRADLGEKDTVLFLQVLNDVLLLLVHPPGYGNEQQAERIQGFQNFWRLSLSPAGLDFCRLEFLDTTRSSFW